MLRSILLALVVVSVTSTSSAQSGGVIEARGEATYRIPIVVPPGPAGHQPDLALVYNSGDGKGPAGWLGFGWSLAGESRIERETRTGTPYDFDNLTCGDPGDPPCYRSDFTLDGEDLICDEASCASCTTAAPCRYRTQSDDGRIILRLGATDGWVIHDRDGRTLDYGSSAPTRLHNPMSGEVFSWQIEKSTDVSGNEIEYFYDTSSSPNLAYVHRITWGQGSEANRSVEFVLNHPTSAARPDRPVTARPGFLQQIDRRAASIEVRAQGGAFVARYYLGYSQDPDSTRSQLASVQRVDLPGAPLMPPHIFSYSFREPGTGFSPAPESGFVATATTCPPFGGARVGIGGMSRNVADMNRDGLADLYDVALSGGEQMTGPTEVALGTGTEFRTAAGPVCTSSSVRGEEWASQPLPFVYGTQGGGLDVLTVDINGDGFLDHVSRLTETIRLGSANGFSPDPVYASIDLPHTWTFGWETGNGGFAAADTLWLKSASSFGIPWTGGSFYSTTHAMADVTGDGRPDLLVSTPALGTPYSPPYFSSSTDPTWATWVGWALFVNRGVKQVGGASFIDFGSGPIRWLAPERGVIEARQGPVIHTALLDQNGDGLADRMVQGGAIEYGYGAGFYGAEIVNSPSPLYLGGVITQSSCTSSDTIDINGDGFSDHVIGVNSGGTAPLQVFFGTGYGFSENSANLDRNTALVNTLEGEGSCGATQSLRDVNGDGRLDYLGGAVYLQDLLTNHAGVRSEPLAGLLTQAVDPFGGTLEFSYRTAPQFQDSEGLPANPDMPLPKPVVVRTVLSDGRRNGQGEALTPTITTRFSYSGGLYDFTEDEFRGFAAVVATQVEDGVDGTATTTLFRTDRDCAFNPTSVQTARGATVFTRSTFTYQTVPPNPTAPDEWVKCLPAARVDESVEGSEANKRVRRTSWNYGTPIDPSYNLARLEEWGEWNLTTGQDVAGDERITEFEYAQPLPGHPSIVSRVSLETTEDANNNVYAKRRYCYSTGCDDAADGLVRSIRDFLTDYTAEQPIVDDERTVATIEYDAHGNPVRLRGPATIDDANGLETMVVYDDDYETFPTAIRRGSDVPLPLQPLETRLLYTGCADGLSPPPALGLPCRVEAPQGQLDVFGYDSLGRVVRVERPESGYLETRSYTLPGAVDPGENEFETRIIRFGQADLLTRELVDGLSRVYQSSEPAKEGQTAIVDRTFDSRGRLRTQTLPSFTGNGPITTFFYDPLGRPATALEPDGTHRVHTYEPWVVLDETYFGAPPAGTRQERTQRRTDGLGRLVEVVQYADALDAASPRALTARYDAADRLYEVHDPIANDPGLCGGMGAACLGQQHVTEIQWDTFGRRVRIEDPDSGIWVYRYDDAGLIKERRHNPESGSGRTQLFSYDQLERLSAKSFSPIGSGVASATFVYENASGSPEFGQLIEVNSPGGTTYLYGYDSAGRLVEQTQRTANWEFVTSWELDELDRVTRRHFPDDDAFDYTYDGTRLVGIHAAPGNTAFTGVVLKDADYDALGRMKRVEIGEGLGGAALATNVYTYDPTTERLARTVGTPANLLPNDPDGDRVDAATDRCLHAYDPDQLDGGGIGDTSAPDGIGNACQCGDVDASGRVTMDDAFAILTQGFSLTPLARPDLCDVNGDTVCDPNDFFAVMNALPPGSGDLQLCPASLPGNVPSSAGLDLTVEIDGLGRLTEQSGWLSGEPVDREYTYDGLSRLLAARGPWEKSRGWSDPVTWTYSYDALGNLRSQVSTESPPWSSDHRTWSYNHPTKPRFLTQLVQSGSGGVSEGMVATPGGEPAWVDPGMGYNPEPLTWNAQGMLHRYEDSSYSYDVFGETTLVVTGVGGVTTSIISVGDDFEYDTNASRANKHFSIDGVRIASLATSYAAPTVSIVPPAVRIVLRYAEPLAAPAAGALLALGLVSLASLTLRRRTPVWLSAPGVGVLSFALVVVPYSADAATLTTGAGQYGRHGEPILAYLVDHLGTVRAAVNRDGIVVETRDYAPFGESIAHVGAFSVQHRFTGQPQDDLEGGLYNYGARFYNPKWGRFVSPDEMVQSFDSQGLNPYTYVLNRPTSWTDPTGNQGDGGVSAGMSAGFGGGMGSLASGGGVVGSGAATGWSTFSWLSSGGGKRQDELGFPDLRDIRKLLRLLSQVEPRTAVRAHGKGRDVHITYNDKSIEVRSGGTRAWRNNNPGNLRPYEFSKRHGAIGEAGGFAVFPDEATGQAALTRLLRTDTYQNLTVDEALARFAPPTENATEKYKGFVGEATGIEGSTPMKTLNKAQLNSVAGAIRRMEGWRVGSVTHRSP